MADQPVADPTFADIRKKYPEYDKVPDGQFADALYDKFYSDMPRIKFYAKVGYDPFSLDKLPHDPSELVRGMIPSAAADEIGIPKPTNYEDKRNNTAGSEMDAALLAGRRPPGATSMLQPPNFRGGPSGSWNNVPEGQAGGGVLSQKMTAPIAGAAGAIGSAITSPAAKAVAGHLANQGVPSATIIGTMGPPKALRIVLRNEQHRHHTQGQHG